jgi:hypothetical protein
MRWSLMTALGSDDAVLHRQQRLERVEHARLVVDEEDGIERAHALRRPARRGSAP